MDRVVPAPCSEEKGQKREIGDGFVKFTAALNELQLPSCGCSPCAQLSFQEISGEPQVQQQYQAGCQIFRLDI